MTEHPEEQSRRIKSELLDLLTSGPDVRYRNALLALLGRIRKLGIPKVCRLHVPTAFEVVAGEVMATRG